jgi:cobalt transporter subunit CbtB
MLETDALTKRQATPVAGRAAVLLPALSAILLGLIILWGVGFAGPSVIHNVAHDSRHSFAFPCH